MYHISARRATEENYGLITKDNRPIEFEDRTSSKKMGIVNIEYKRSMIVS
jgi:hypothetical protein